MKYVRVYESDCYPEEYITTYLNHCEHVVNLQDAGFDFEGCIVKQADTIEELCDGYYVDVDNHSFDICCVYEELDKANYCANDWKAYSDRKELEYVIVIYGFIKTNKGLIYVAKMNDKGELELC